MTEKYQLNENELIIYDEDLSIDLKSNLKVEKKELYYEDKRLLAENYYHKKLLHGPSIFYTKNRDILSITWFFEGKKNGIAKKYYSSKKLYSIEKYVDDKMQKEQIYYFEDGSIKTIMNYDMGLLHGEVKLFYENEKLKRHLIFEKGKKIQDNIFDEKEKLVDETKFEL